MKHLTRTIAIGAAITLFGAACSSAPDTPESIVLLTHDSFALSEGTLDTFTEQTGVAVEVHSTGDAGSMVTQAILTKDNPIADVMFGVDNTFLSRALSNDLFLEHEAAAIGTVSDLIRVPGDLATPIDFGDVCINYDIEALTAADTSPPQTLEDLLSPTYRDLLVVQDPATSSPGLAFLMATIAAYPDGATYDWKAYWTDLFANGVAVASDWSEAYYAEFTRAGGSRPLVVSDASSPPAEVFFGELDEVPTGVMTEGCFRQVEFAGVLSGTAYPETAGLLVDFLLSVDVQEDIPLNMFVYPTNSEAELPEVFEEYTILPDAPVVMEPNTIEQNRERWIAEWTTIARS
ncbi:MAG: thiamine ABC transporter substrate-binding protein [Acidimicrobiia bacterium]